MTHAARTTLRLRPLALALFLGGTLSSAFATDGYFSHGYGMKAKGMGGASVAVAQDGFAGANNPARASFSGNRIEVGGDFFMPDRSASRTGNPMGLNATVESDSKLFLVPEFAYNRTVNDRLSAGLTVYGNGGMNTDYAGGQVNCGQGPANLLCGSGRLGVDLMQVVLAPTVAYKLNDRHAIGVSALLVHQQFKADGLQAFTNPRMTSDSSKVTNNGFDTSNGLGVRLGYFGKLNDKVSIGASYSPKISMSKFSDYAGLFAEQGKLDIPENYSVGAAFQATPDVMLAVDYQRINYSGVASIGNPSTNQAQLGSANGPGFGWKDVGVIKLGVQWQATPRLALRAGYNKSQNPIEGRDVTFNILAPGVITTHVTLGGTYALSPSTEMTVAYMHAPRQSVTGQSSFGGTETIGMSQNSLGLQVGWKF
ncbi:MAG: outer membrane protein transport protein [Rhodoferax sp.]|nr:outer membrane protein transport protein [Rhodoferax sp.]